jgi:hypothetical protein
MANRMPGAFGGLESLGSNFNETEEYFFRKMDENKYKKKIRTNP